ncbi:MAG: cupin domain-containing protein [Candidatus Dadabacteria bacterium]
MNTALNSALFQLSEQIQWEPAGKGIERQVYGFNHALMMVKVKFEKGAVGTLHEHLHTQVSYVESGSFELTIGNEKKLLKKGDGYFVPPHELHGCVCMEAGVLIDVFNPLREDFLKK